MKILSARKTKSSSKMKNFPTIMIGSQKLRDKIKARTKAKKRRKKLMKNRLICEKCKEGFLTWWEIRDHWKSSGHKEPEECRWCRKKTYTLQSHLCKEHWNLACMCVYCGQLFMFQEGLQEHQQRHDGREYRCYMCGKRQKNDDLLRKHIFKHYVYERYGCNVCEKRFKKKKNVEKHLKYVHFICQYCGCTCEDKDKLIDHWNTHDDLKCVFCHKVFSQKNRLKYHFQMKHGHQDFYKCSLCFERFPLKSRLLDHYKLKHKGYAKISCEICEMPFLYWSLYLKHFEQVHVTPQDKYFCSFCEYSTNVKSKLQWHVEKTSGDGFFCKVCQTRSECKTRFDEHMKVHEGKRVYNCDYCDKSYATIDILKHHLSVLHQEVIIESNTRGHPCLVPGCERYYTSKSSLARHMRRNHPVAELAGPSGQFCADNTVVCRLPLTLDRKAFQQCHEESFVSSSTQRCPDDLEALSPEKPNEKTGFEALSPEKPNEKTGFEEKVVSDSQSTVCCSWSNKDEGNSDLTVSSSLKNKDEGNGDLTESSSLKNKEKENSDLTVSSSLKNTDEVNRELIASSLLKNKEKENSESMVSSSSENKDEENSESEMVEVDVYYCDICCKFWFAGDKQFRKHMTTHNKQVWDDECLECEEILETPEDAVRHYVEDHLKAEYKRY